MPDYDADERFREAQQTYEELKARLAELNQAQQAKRDRRLRSGRATPRTRHDHLAWMEGQRDRDREPATQDTVPDNPTLTANRCPRCKAEPGVPCRWRNRPPAGQTVHHARLKNTDPDQPPHDTVEPIDLDTL